MLRISVDLVLSLLNRWRQGLEASWKQEPFAAKDELLGQAVQQGQLRLQFRTPFIERKL